MSPMAFLWDLTYACPYRCDHCYTESGRRPSGQLPLADLLRIADILVAARPAPSVLLAGGEPLVVKGLCEIAERLSAGGATVTLYTSGWRLDEEMARRLGGACAQISVSVDAPDPATNDFLRGRAGAFDDAMEALAILDRVAADADGRNRFGIECVVMRSNLDRLEAFCTEVAPRFRRLRFLRFGFLVPSGLASREGYVAREYLTEDDLTRLPAQADRLGALCPGSVELRMCSPASELSLARGELPACMLSIEAQGAVRPVPIYEGTVGNLLTDPLQLLVQRAKEWLADPFLVEQQRSIHVLADWPAAARRIDERFASPPALARINARAPADPSPANRRPPSHPPSRL